MDAALETLGLRSLLLSPTRTKRQQVMAPTRRFSNSKQVSQSCRLPFGHRDSFTLLTNAQSKKLIRHKGLIFSLDGEDNDTVTTASLDDSSFTLTSEDEDESTRTVRFAKEIVSEVRYRPFTTKKEKELLFYNEFDYYDFKMEYYTGKGRQVRFANDIVSEVHTFAPPDTNKEALYYTNKELQEFLDDFVMSLNQPIA